MERYDYREALASIWGRWRRPPVCIDIDPRGTPSLTETLDPDDPPRPRAPVYHDLRGAKRTESRGKSKGVRDWSKVTGITLHQTAAVMRTPKRFLSVPVHGATLPDGSCVLLHDPTALMWHGNGFNSRDIGIEVSCQAAGVEGVSNTLWRPASKPDLEATEATDEQLEATRHLVRHYVDLVAANGGRIQYIHAHRQATSQRVSDPGSRIWLAVGEWAREELGLEVGPPDFCIGTGKPLPDAWTGRPNGIEYGWQYDGRLA